LIPLNHLKIALNTPIINFKAFRVLSCIMKMQNKAQNKLTDALNTHHLIPIPSNENSVRMRPVAFWRFSEILSKPFQLTKEFSFFVLSLFTL
ncbi:hypothetical protein, partial [Escherichia coli]|uniref:hypothetical protein n=1 Tax=Escherichia coli TaxID=562 RepID=UPI001BC8BFE8